MGLFDRFRRRNTQAATESMPQRNTRVNNEETVVVGAGNEKDEVQIQSFSNSNITFNGNLAGYDYSAILRDKQSNIVSLYQQADYYGDSDPIVRGILRHVFTPYSTCSPWVLSGAKPKTCALFEEQYKKMRIREKMNGIFFEYWKYGNVFLYLLNGQLITLPVHKCKIGNITLNGKPIVDYDCQSIINDWRSKNYTVKEGWIKENNLDAYFSGYPEEVKKAINEGKQYAQLNPENTFVFQGDKESWQRYSVPFIAACLPALAKKELISTYEDSVLNLGIRSLVHVRYGDPTKGADILPGATELSQVRTLFQKGMSGFPLVVTNHLAQANVIQPNLDDLFQWNKYKEVNSDILSAGGVSAVIVNGTAEDGSAFASAKISADTAATRIEAARDEFCELMNWVNERLKEVIPGTYNLKETPKFSFQPLDMSGKKALREVCRELWAQGLVSTRTMMETHGYNIDAEKTKREQEKSDGIDKALAPRDGSHQVPEETGKQGRPEMTDDERTSDPGASERGKQPKPSNEDGSMDV